MSIVGRVRLVASCPALRGRLLSIRDLMGRGQPERFLSAVAGSAGFIPYPEGTT